MKNIFGHITFLVSAEKFLTIIVLSFAVQFCFGQSGCNNNVPNWGESLGIVSFRTERTWVVGKQEWSDVVMATACRKETFDGGKSRKFNADCRSNGSHGDLFSWCAVMRFQTQLCPDEWRVPTRHDFIALDIALGGNGRHRKNDQHLLKYVDVWGITYGGFCIESGWLRTQDFSAHYWSSSSGSRSVAYSLSFLASINPISVNPQDYGSKDFGFSLRCVRDK